MKKEFFTNLAVLVATILYVTLFYQSESGLNVWLYTSGLIGFLLLQDPDRLKSYPVLISGGAALIGALMIVVHHSALAQWTHQVGMLALVGFSQDRTLRFLGYGFLMALINLFETPKHYFMQFKELIEAISPRWVPLLRYVQLSLIPLLIAGLFFGLYCAANPHLETAVNKTFGWLSGLFQWEVDPELLGRIFFGMLFAGAIFYKTSFQLLAHWQGKHRETLQRLRNSQMLRLPTGMLGLKREYRMGLILLSTLNGLLLVVNLLDLKYIWMNGQELGPAQLSNFVHEGTYVLIVTILMAMGILLYWFRDNLNFYPDNRSLKLLAYAWIIQNAWLVLSVATRNYHYVHAYGFTHKRLGVFVFLLLVLAGLFLLLLKIRDKKSAYFLVKRNMEVAFVVLLLSSLVNWDMAITRYNLQFPPSKGLDAGYLLYRLSDKNTALLYQKRHILLIKNNRPEIDIPQALQHKVDRFWDRQQYDWRAWNWMDYRNRRWLQTLNLD